MCDMLADRQHATKQFSLLAETGEWTKFARVYVCVCLCVASVPASERSVSKQSCALKFHGPPMSQEIL